MSAVDTFKQYIESTVAVNLMHSLVQDGKYKDAVAKTNDFIQKTFPDKSDDVKIALAVLGNAYLRELLVGVKDGYAKAGM